MCVHHQFNLRLHGPGDLLVALNVDTKRHGSTCILVDEDINLALLNESAKCHFLDLNPKPFLNIYSMHLSPLFTIELEFYYLFIR